MAFMDMGFSHEVNSTEVMPKEVAAIVLMGVIANQAYKTMIIPGMKVALNHSSICLISCALDYEVMPFSQKLMDIKEWKEEGRSTLAMLFSQEIYRLAAWRLLLLRMEADSSSAWLLLFQIRWTQS